LQCKAVLTEQKQWNLVRTRGQDFSPWILPVKHALFESSRLERKTVNW
jgi:hypothetical protein